MEIDSRFTEWPVLDWMVMGLKQIAWSQGPYSVNTAILGSRGSQHSAVHCCAAGANSVLTLLDV